MDRILEQDSIELDTTGLAVFIQARFKPLSSSSVIFNDSNSQHQHLLDPARSNTALFYNYTAGLHAVAAHKLTPVGGNHGKGRKLSMLQT